MSPTLWVVVAWRTPDLVGAVGLNNFVAVIVVTATVITIVKSNNNRVSLSLINTEGKAYVMVILNRVRTYLEAQLLDAQQGSGNSVAHQMPYSAYGA